MTANRKLSQTQWDTLCQLDNVRRSLLAVSQEAHDQATVALLTTARATLGTIPGERLVLAVGQTENMDAALMQIGYSVITPPAPPKVYVVVSDCTPYCAHVTADSANHWISDNRLGDEIHPVDLLVADADIEGVGDLDMLAYDISDTMSKGDYGMTDVAQDEIRAALPVFLALAAAHARANPDG